MVSRVTLSPDNPISCENVALDIPEWLSQRIKIQSGEATWEDFSFEERTCKGWLMPYLIEIDSFISKRWDYWLRTLQAGNLLDEPIPQISFEGEGHTSSETMKMLRKCLDDYCCYAQSISLPDFFEWLLWGFNDPDQTERPYKINEKINEHWYRNFNLGLMIQHPHDYLGDLLADSKAGKTYWNNPHAFFPTPHNVCEMMYKMTIGDDLKADASVCDPCAGTGRMLMCASNHSVNLWGIDIDRTCVMGCKINGYLYIPWLVKPAPWLCGGGNLRHGDALAMPVPAEPVKDVKPIEKIVEVSQYKILKNSDQMRLF